MRSVTDIIRRGLNVVGENSQLNYTLFVMLVVVVVFTYLATQFVGIARDAQDRLVRVRAGAIHDVVTLFSSAEQLSDIAYSRERIEALAGLNQTLRSFVVVSFTNEGPEVVNALDPRLIGSFDSDYLELYQLASTDPRRSFAHETVDGEERMYEVIRVLTNEQGEVVGAVRTGLTLSEADRLINANIQQSLVGFTVLLVLLLILFLRHARIVDYASLYRRLQEVDALKDDFIAMATHELRTPLTVVRGYIELLSESRDLSDTDREHLKKIEISAEQLQELIEDMLDVSRVEQGRMTFELETVSLGSELEEQASNLRENASQKGLALNLEVEQECTVVVDRKRFRQIMTNIIGNAIKYTLAGSVTISLRYENGRAIIRVRDTGIGMSAAEREQLFEKFSRIQNADTQGIRGTGLGLWLTKQMVEEMQGTIAIESIRNIGTHVIITFPCEPPA